MSTKENGVLSNGCSQRPRKRATSLSWWLSVTKENVERVHVGKQSRSKDVAVKSGVVVSCHESSVSCHDVAVKSGVGKSELQDSGYSEKRQN
ncbi:hypothetical protein YC2023_020364 [Brassica napus]